MNFFLKNTILRRVLFYFLLFAVFLLALVFALYTTGQEFISIYVFAGALGIFLVYFLLVYYYEITKPLKVILEQMRALLTGKKYSKIFTQRMDEIGIIAHFFNEVTKSFEKVSLDIREGKRMLSELEIAGKIQQDILPPQNPIVKGLDIVAKNRPAVELGGDSFDFITKGDNTFIYVGDVTGHGVPAALIMTIINTLIHTFVDIYDNAYDVLFNTNKQLKNRIKSTMFMTLLMLRWNHTEQKMSYVGAGHEHLVIYRTANGKCEVIKSGGIALGMVPDNSKLIKEEDITLNEGDVIILYTDGVTEGRNMAGELYTLERMVEAVERFASQYGPDGIVNHVALNYSSFVENHIQDDDVTLIAVQYVGDKAKEKGSGAPSSISWVSEDKVTSKEPSEEPEAPGDEPEATKESVKPADSESKEN